MGKIEELYRSIVDQFAQAHIREPTGQINFTRFMNSLYDLDEDPIFKGWLNRNDDVVEVMAGGFCAAEPAAVQCSQDENSNPVMLLSATHRSGGSCATNNDGVSVAATAGSSPAAASRCVQLNVIDILSTFENRILGDAVLKASANTLENTLRAALDRETLKLERENEDLKNQLAKTIAEALRDYKVQDDMAALCHTIVMQDDDNNKRAAQTAEWRACKQVLEELMFED